VGTVIVLDDVGLGSKADQLRNEGKFVVGGSPYTDKLELDREFGQAELNLGGVDVLPSWNFTSFDEAIDFVRANPDRYVLKPSGKAQNEKELLFIGQEGDGKDVLQVLEHYRTNWSKKIKEFQIQKYAEGVEIAVGAFFNGKDFVMPLCVNFEHKRLFPHELGPSTGEMGTAIMYTRDSPVFERTLLKMKDKLAASRYVGYIDINCIANGKGIWPLEWTCYDSSTEILTREGWKAFEEVGVGDEALAMNPENREMGWKRITGKLVKEYNGEMIRLSAVGKKHGGFDALVTPDHNMLVEHSGKLRLTNADALPVQEAKIVRSGWFRGISVEKVMIPEYLETHYLASRRTSMQVVHPAIEVPAEPFMKLLGLYLAGGSCGDHTVSIAQDPQGDEREEITKILRETGLRFTELKSGGYQLNSRQVCVFIEQLGLQGDAAAAKFVPRHFKELEPRLLEALLYGYRLGAGNVHGMSGQASFATTSRRLTDDIQELLLKCGKVGNVRHSKQKGTVSIGGYVRGEDTYIISVRELKDFPLDKRVISRERYVGKVWDVEVEDWHTMLVRRGGKAFFSGNCRFGYPTISIQMEGITSEWGQFLYDLAHKNETQLKTRKGYQIGVVVAIPPWPFEDEKAFKKYSEGATILFRRQSLEGIHIGEVKLEEGDWHIAGNSGYALVVTGSGATMADAIEKAYQNVKNVMIPNMFYRTDIGQRWTHDSDMLLSWGYI
jgi:phosphoribosylamine-glycine ligase